MQTASVLCQWLMKDKYSSSALTVFVIVPGWEHVFVEQSFKEVAMSSKAVQHIKELIYGNHK